MEELANREDESSREVVAVKVCERLGDDPNILRKARKYIGTKTLELSRQVERFWGREVAESSISP